MVCGLFLVLFEDFFWKQQQKQQKHFLSVSFFFSVSGFLGYSPASANNTCELVFVFIEMSIIFLLLQ